MSNLSDLLPAGASGKTIEAVATANITSKAPVILNSAGTVSPISETAGAMGTSGDQGTGTRTGGESGACYHITNDSTVISFPNSGNSSYATVAVCTLSGTTMTMNTPTVVNSTACYFVRCAYDPTQNCIVVYYKYNGGTNLGKVRAATVSGTSFSFGTELSAFGGNAHGNTPGDICNLNDSSVAICWGSASPLSACVQAMTISGTTLTLGTGVSVSSNTSNPMRMDSGKKGELLCQLGYTSHIQYVACTVSGTTVTAGTVTEIGGGSSTVNDLASGFWNGYTSPESTYIAAYHTPGGASGVTLGRLITVSGTTLTLNATTSLAADATGNPAMGWGSSATQAIFYYRPDSDSSIGQVTELNYSGTTISEGATVTVGATNYTNWGVATDQVAKKSIVMYQDGSNSDAAEVNVYSPTSSNLTATNFVGIADAAISSSATGTIVVQGGTATGVSLDPYFSLGTPVVYETATTYYTASTYDSTNDKTVICYRDNGNGGAGTAIVGTVSGTTISYGTAVVFDSGSTNQMSATFDTNSGKIVIVYEDADASQQGTAVVGTVSGTGISFGTPVVFKGSETGGPPVVTYDSTAQKVVVVYNVNSTTNKGHAIVGTVSGTSISFGTEVIFKNDIYNSQFGVAYDANADRTVITYQKNGGNGTAIVGTVSGTGISFGTEVVYNSADSTGNNAVYDPDSQKVVIAFVTVGVGKGVVGTVSGTGISFGALATFAASDVAGGLTNSNPIAYDTAQDKVVLVYEDTTANTLYANTGTVSGTSISFGTATTLTTNNTGYAVVSYDPDVQRSVFAYADGGSSDHGTAIVGTLSGDLATGSKYYVTTTGGYSTSAGSPSVSAGLAISTTSLLLNGDS